MRQRGIDLCVKVARLNWTACHSAAVSNATLVVRHGHLPTSYDDLMDDPSSVMGHEGVGLETRDRSGD